MEKCRPALVVVHQTKIAATAVEEKPNDNLSVPYGLIRTVRHYLEFVGILRYIRGLKTKGVRLDLIVVALCTYTMYASNSMNACAEWLENPAVRRQLGFSAKEEVSQRTLNRALETLGQNREGIITELWNGIRSRFEIDDYDINLDGSAVVLYGPKSDYAEKGYGRDKNRGKMQVGVSIHTIQSWLGVLVAGGIVRLLQPYFERSNVKRIVKRPKIYFCDTGLACYLAKVFDAETLRVGYLGGHMVETFIINEIMKTYTNNTEEAGFYYYRDADKNEVDFLILRNAKLSDRVQGRDDI